MTFKFVTTIATLSFISISTFAHSFDPLIGTWKVIDNRTDSYLSDIVIRKNSKTQQYSAVITQLHGSYSTLKTCQKCTGHFKNQPILGMETLSGLVANTNKNQLSKGIWINPENGYLYHVNARLNNTGTQLQVTGEANKKYNISMLWIKVQDVN